MAGGGASSRGAAAVAELLVPFVELDGARYRLSVQALSEYLAGRRRPLHIGEQEVWPDPVQVAEYLGEAPPPDFVPEGAQRVPLHVERFPLSAAMVERYLTSPPTAATGERRLDFSPVSGARIRYLTG